MKSNSFFSTLLTPIILLLMILTSGCREQKQIRGGEFVSREMMVDMMVDMHLIDGLTNDVSYYRKFNPNDTINLYGSVYEEFGVSRKEFHSTMLEYASSPRLLDKLYGDVLKELNLMQEDLDKKKELELNKKKPVLGGKKSQKMVK